MSVTIRLAVAADAEQICEIYAPIVRDTHISFEQDIPDAAEMAARISKTMPRYPWLVCDIEERVAGYAYASPFRRRKAYQWTAETTVYVRPDYKRRGVSRALYTSLIAVLREQGYCNAVGVIALPNDASIRAHEAVGFRKVGVLENMGFKAGAWHHTGWWQLELRPMPDQPQRPRALTSLTEPSLLDRLLGAGLPFLKQINVHIEESR